LLWFKNRAFFKGCLVKNAYPGIGELWVKILRELGVKVITLPEERCCGSPLKNAGAVKEYEKNAQMLRCLMDKYHVGEVITACPACANVLSQYLRVPVRHVTQVVADRLCKRVLKPWNTTVVFHDPCHLARAVGAVDEPRKILRACGCKVVEPELGEKHTYCCGGGGGLPANHPETAEKISKERVRQLFSTGAELIVTSCPMCLHQLRKNSNLQVLDLSEIVAKALGVRG